MARLNTVDPAAATGRVREIFDGPLAGKHINIFKGMGNSPVGLDAYLGLAGALGQGSLSDAEREAIALAIGEANACDYCKAAHTALGKGAGLSEAQTLDARRGSVDDARLGPLVRFALQIHEKRGFVDDADLEAFRAAGFSDGEVVEVLVTYVLNLYTNYFNHINDTPVDFPAAPALA